MPHPRRIPLVQLVRISNPCPLAGRAWGADERSWHCPQCDLDVHNFSAMTAAEADAVLAAGRASGRVCARFVADRRGAPITADRPWALLGARLAGRLAHAAAALGLAALLGGRLAGCADEPRAMMGAPAPENFTVPHDPAQPPTTPPTQPPRAR